MWGFAFFSSLGSVGTGWIQVPVCERGVEMVGLEHVLARPIPPCCPPAEGWASWPAWEHEPSQPNPEGPGRTHAQGRHGTHPLQPLLSGQLCHGCLQPPEKEFLLLRVKTIV